jgi:hypothetical protein
MAPFRYWHAGGLPPPRQVLLLDELLRWKDKDTDTEYTEELHSAKVPPTDISTSAIGNDTEKISMTHYKDKKMQEEDEKVKVKKKQKKKQKKEDVEMMDVNEIEDEGGCFPAARVLLPLPGVGCRVKQEAKEALTSSKPELEEEKRQRKMEFNGMSEFIVTHYDTKDNTQIEKNAPEDDNEKISMTPAFIHDIAPTLLPVYKREHFAEWQVGNSFFTKLDSARAAASAKLAYQATENLHAEDSIHDIQKQFNLGEGAPATPSSNQIYNNTHEHDLFDLEGMEIVDDEEMRSSYYSSCSPRSSFSRVTKDEFEDNDLDQLMHFNEAVSRGLTESGSFNYRALNGAMSPGRPSCDASSAFCNPGSLLEPNSKLHDQIET